MKLMQINDYNEHNKFEESYYLYCLIYLEKNHYYYLLNLYLYFDYL